MIKLQHLEIIQDITNTVNQYILMLICLFLFFVKGDCLKLVYGEGHDVSRLVLYINVVGTGRLWCNCAGKLVQESAPWVIGCTRPVE